MHLFVSIASGAGNSCFLGNRWILWSRLCSAFVQYWIDENIGCISYDFLQIVSVMKMLRSQSLRDLFFRLTYHRLVCWSADWYEFWWVLLYFHWVLDVDCFLLKVKQRMIWCWKSWFSLEPSARMMPVLGCLLSLTSFRTLLNFWTVGSFLHLSSLSFPHWYLVLF